MPTYEYRCVACNHQFERFQKMSDDPVKECEVCGAEVQRVLFPVAVHFKGSGFYTTDYGKKKTLPGGSNGGSDSAASSSTDNGSNGSKAEKSKSPSETSGAGKKTGGASAE